MLITVIGHLFVASAWVLVAAWLRSGCTNLS